MHIRASEQEELEGLDEMYLEDGPIMGYPHKTEDTTLTYGVGGSSPTETVPLNKSEAQKV
jgi:hypothetical protein